MNLSRANFRPRVRDALQPHVLLCLLVGCLAIASCADHVRHSKTATDWKLDRKTGVVTHVADGDTIDVDFDDAVPPLRVRLLGVDPPELGSELGEAAKRYAIARCDRQRVTIRLDSLQGTRDKYGRLLAYVYLPNHELLNNSLVRDGHAFAYRPKRCDFSSQIEASENAARVAKRGMWKSVTTKDMPEWRVRWMSERGIK